MTAYLMARLYACCRGTVTHIRVYVSLRPRPDYRVPFKERKHIGFFGFEKKRPSGNDLTLTLMKLPITQQHIDEAIEKIRQRKLSNVKVIPKVKAVKHKKYRPYVPKESNIEKMMDYAIWNDDKHDNARNNLTNAESLDSTSLNS